MKNDFFYPNQAPPPLWDYNIRLLPQNRQDPNWEIRKTKNWPKSSGFPNLDPPNLQILEPPGSCRLQDFQILATGSANLEGPKNGNSWILVSFNRK